MLYSIFLPDVLCSITLPLPHSAIGWSAVCDVVHVFPGHTHVLSSLEMITLWDNR